MTFCPHTGQGTINYRMDKELAPLSLASLHVEVLGLEILSLNTDLYYLYTPKMMG